jgi:GNAT superfamily N-acetyltransferase
VSDATSNHRPGAVLLLVLPDGAAVLLRPLERDDAWAVHSVFTDLSPDSRRLRFGTAKTGLSEPELQTLTAVDHRAHEALVALEPATGRPLGIARFVRDAEQPEVAEVAFAVVDDWHGRGLGTLLLSRLAARARELGVRQFTAHVLAGNAPALALVRRLGRVVGAGFGGGAIELEVQLGAGGGRDATAPLRAAA